MRYVLGFLLLLGGTVQAQLADFTNVSFHRADSIAALYEGESLENLPLLAYHLTAPLPSQVEQFRAIYTWVCTNIYNDYGNNRKNREKRKKLQHDSQALAEWNAEFRAEVFRRLLKKQKTVCTGYAYLVRELAMLAGINCKIIDGYGRTVAANIGEPGIPNHSWNAVQLNNRWYLCDATWSSGHTTLPSLTYVHEYNDGYFLANPAWFVMNHYPLDSAWMLLDHPPTLSDFLQAPLLYKHAFSYHIVPVEPRTMNVAVFKNEDLRLVFEARDSLDLSTINLELFTGAKSEEVSPNIHRTEMGLLVLTYRFDRRGQYDVHIKLNTEYIATYTVQVKKDKR